MGNNYKVGVNIVEGVPLSPVEGLSSANVAILGTFQKGPVNKATLVTNFADFERLFGTGPATGSTSYYSVKAFFQKVGSGQAYIVRVAGTGVLKANYTFVDRQGSPANTLKIEGKTEGLWGNGISCKIVDYSLVNTKPSVSITAGATDATLVVTEGLEIGSDLKFYNGTNTEYKRITNVDHAAKKVYWSGGLTYGYTTVNGVITSMEFSIEVYWKGVLVETWTGLSMCNTVSFYVQKKVISDYILTTDLKTADTAYTDLPAVTATPTVLANGNDGLSGILAADYVGTEAGKTGMYALDAVENLFRFACPNPLITDVSPSTAYEGLVQSLLDYANVRSTVQFYADIPYGTSVANAKVFGDKFSGRRVAMFWPWLKVKESGLDVWLPPSTFVLGCAVEKDYRRGVHKSVGNEQLAYTIDLEYSVSVGEGETLNNANINTIRYFPGAGIRTYGGRTKSAVTAYRFLHISELWNFIAMSLAQGTRDIPFEPNNLMLWRSTKRRIEAFMDSLVASGALFDASNPTGTPYLVVMDGDQQPVRSGGAGDRPGAGGVRTGIGRREVRDRVDRIAGRPDRGEDQTVRRRHNERIRR